MLAIIFEFFILSFIRCKRKSQFVVKQLKQKKTSVLVVAFLFISLPIFAANPKITFQGRVVKSDGQGLTDNAVQFKVQIRAPNAQSCILYEETRTVDMTDSSGLFTLDLNGGSGTRTDTNSFAFAETLSNYKAFAVSSSLCASGSGTVTYTPAASDERLVKMYFKDSTMGAWEAMPDSTLTHSAYAYESRQVGGFAASSLLRVENGSGPQTATAFTPAQFTDLTDLIAGTSTKYAQIQANAGTALSQSSGNPSTLTAGNVWYDTADNKLKFYNGTSVVILGPDSSVSVSTGAVSVSSTSSATSASIVTLSPALSATVAAETTASRSIISPVIQTGVTSSGPLIGSANLALRNYNAAGDVGTASYLEGVQVNYGHSNFDGSSPTTTNAYGVLIYPYTKTGTITNMIDVYLASALTGSGTVTNGWGIYQQNTKPNSFAGKVGLGMGSTIPTALLQIASGGTAAGTAPLKFTAGGLLTTTEDGAMEYDGTNYYLTYGTTRRSIASGSSPGNVDNTSGNVTLNPNTATGAVLVSATTASTAYNNGALVVSGGAGIAENLNVQGNITSLGTIAASTSVTSPIMYGSSSASGNLTIESTSNATKGNIILAPSGGNVGIGTTSPSAVLTVESASNPPAMFIRTNTASSSTMVAAAVKSKTTATMADGYGTALSFRVEGNGVTETSYGSIGMVRDGADNSSKINFANVSAGVSQTSMVINSAGKVGIGTTSPTHSLTLNSTSTGYANYNTTDQTTNYERGIFQWVSNVLYLGTEFGGTGASRVLKIGSAGIAGTAISTSARTLDFSSTVPFFKVSNSTSLAGNNFDFSGMNLSGANVSQVAFAINPTMNQSGTSSYTALLVNPTETATGSGNKFLADFQVGGSSKVTILSSGNVGIGTTAPATDLTVTSKSAGANSVIRIANDTTATGDMNLEFYRNSSNKAGIGLRPGGGSTSMNLYDNHASGSISFSTGATPTERMRISASGNVGIGTTSPSYILDVAGNGGNVTAIFGADSSAATRTDATNKATRIAMPHYTNAEEPAALIYATSGSSWNAVNFGGGTALVNAATTLSFYTAANNTTTTGTERMTINGSGYVGIGTTTPNATLQVVGTITGKAGVSNAGTTIDFSTGNLQYTTANCQAYVLHNVKDGGSYTFAVQGATAATCSFTAFSDAGTTALTVHLPPDHAATTASKHTLYNLMNLGGHVYIAWTPGY